MRAILYIIGGPLFLVSVIAHIYVKVRMRPKPGSDFDDYYWEFEHRHPGFARYSRWSQLTFAAAVVAALLLFVAMVL